MKVLLLAGTAEASQLARLLADDSVEVVASFAGHTNPPGDWPCPVWVGGFGGVEGLAAMLSREGFDAVIDATHPFSATMPGNAVRAAARTGVAHLRLVRPPWSPATDDRWDLVADIQAAARRLGALGARCALLTIGRLDVAAFRSITGTRLVVRSIETPDPASLPAGASVVTARGPFDVDDELELLRRHDVDVLVTKNSGGDDAKLRAARQLGVTVLMVQRPAAAAPVDVATVEDARRWVAQRARLAS